MFPFPKVNNRRLPSTNKEKETKGRVSAIEDIIDLISNLSWWFVGLTIFSLFLYTRGSGVNKNQAVILISSYFVFIVYIFWIATNG